MHSLRRYSCRSWAAATALVLAAACNRSAASSRPAVRLVENAANPAASYVEVSGVDAATRNAVGQLTTTSPEWAAVLTVRVVDGGGTPSETPIAGRYTVAGHSLRFTPLFPFDPGRHYEVRYAYADHTPGRPEAITERVALPAGAASAPTQVTQVYPSSDVVPENQLRMYIHFSAPMGRRGGVEHVRLLDESGREVVDPFLPLDAEFWNADRTRYTVFFDPGRQKRGIAPIADMGRSLTEGKSYTLVIDSEWRDGSGVPLTQQFKRTFKVGPPDEQPLDPKTWKVLAPAAGTRGPLQVAFPEPLDHGLLLRALGVVSPDGKPMPGDVVVGEHELTWSFTPREAWPAGAYNIVAFASLEDLAGNRIGRAFEVDQFDRTDKSNEPEKTFIAFVVR